MNNQAEEPPKTAEDHLEELLTLPICEKCYPEVVSALGYLGQKHKKSIGAEQILSVFVEAMELADECAEARFSELKIPQAIIKLKKDHNIEEATIYRYSLKCNVGCVIALLFLIILGAKLKTPTLATERVFVNAISSIYKCLTDDVKNHSALWPMVRKLIPVPPKPKEVKEAATKTPQPVAAQKPAEDPTTETLNEPLTHDDLKARELVGIALAYGITEKPLTQDEANKMLAQMSKLSSTSFNNHWSKFKDADNYSYQQLLSNIQKDKENTK